MHCCQLYTPVSFLATGTIIQHPQNSTILLGENGTFSCEAAGSATTIWRLFHENSISEPVLDNIIDTERTLKNLEVLSTFEGDGIFITTSSMTITGNMKRNFTHVQCTEAPAIIRNNLFDNIGVVFLRVIGKNT